MGTGVESELGQEEGVVVETRRRNTEVKGALSCCWTEATRGEEGLLGIAVVIWPAPGGGGLAKRISRRLEMVVLNHSEREDRQPGEEQVWGLRPRRFTVGKLWPELCVEGCWPGPCAAMEGEK